MRVIVVVFVLALVLLLSSCRSADASGASGGTLDTRVDRIIASSGAETVAVAMIDLETGRTFRRNADVSLHAASTMKVPVMVALFERIDRGELTLDQPVPVRNEFRSILDGSTYTIESSDDSDKELYQHVGQSLPLENLMRRMIVRSSNLATNLLIEFVGAQRVMGLMRDLGAHDIRVLRGVEDIPAFEAGMNNTTTAWDMALVMKAIAEERVVSPAASRQMLAILEDQEFTGAIPAGVPDGVRVANKTGSITRIRHDAAIVLPEDRRPYVLVVLTRGLAKGSDADDVIAAISEAVWETLSR